ncbi:MAG: sel1 repeat family protein [Candidatus Eisenbacteria bacterium]|nr:sel1 repeat family protein [Candidatus Eisenbacteria bacterium]
MSLLLGLALGCASPAQPAQSTTPVSVTTDVEACNQGNEEACCRAGADADKADEARALPFLERCCRASSIAPKRSGAACLLAASHLSEKSGEGETRTASLARLACERQYADMCLLMGDLHLAGAGGASEDPVLGATYYAKGCALGNEMSCLKAGVVYDSGRGVAVDLVKAADFYRRACDDDVALACSILGTYYDEGRGVEADRGRAAKLFARACSEKAPGACANLGYYYLSGIGTPRDDAKAVYYSRLGCDYGDSGACANLGVLVADGRGAPVDVAAGHRLLGSACDKGLAWACGALGVRLYQAGETPRAADLLRKACKALETGKRPSAHEIGPIAQACTFLATLELDGSLGTPRPTEAVHLLELACKERDAGGCGELSAQYLEGKHVTKNTGRAIALMHQACDIGHEKSCKLLNSLDRKK